MKKVTVLLILLALAFSFGNVYAQKIKFSVIGGYSLPMPDLKGTYPDDLTKNPVPYFMKNGFNVGGILKYYVDKKNTIGLTLSGVYNGFSSGDIALTGGTAKAKLNFFQVGLGGEYLFPVKGKVKPFAGIDLTASFISGKDTYTPTSGTASESTLKSATRFGFNVGAGVNFNVAPQIDLVVGAKYQLFNLLGKDSVGTTVANEFTLMDKEVGTSKARNMMGLQIYGGINLNLDLLFKK